MNTAVLATIGIFLAGIIYHAGQLAARVESLEQSRKETRDDLKTIREAVSGIAAAIHGVR